MNDFILRLVSILLDIVRVCMFMAIVFAGVLVISCGWYVLVAPGAPFGIDARAILGDMHTPVTLTALVTTIAGAWYVNRER